MKMKHKKNKLNSTRLMIIAKTHAIIIIPNVYSALLGAAYMFPVTDYYFSIFIAIFTELNTR